MNKKEYWMSFVGLPHHLWSFENGRVILKEIGDMLVEVARDCLTLARVYTLRVKIRGEGIMRS